MGFEVQVTPGRPGVSRGLENVYVKETRISYIDGERGRLYYRGYSIEDLFANATYEEVAYLLVNGELPSRAQLEEFREGVWEGRRLVDADTARLVAEAAVRVEHPLDAARVGLILLAPRLGMKPRIEAKRVRVEELRGKAPKLIGAFQRLVAIAVSSAQGRSDPGPRPGLSSAAYAYLYLTGREPGRSEEEAMDKLLIIYADHEIPASTFTAMVVASTLTDIPFAIDAAVAALRGTLHGGALEEVVKMLHEVELGRAEEYVEKVLSSGRRLMGFGHRVYKTYDPRARLLRHLAGRLASGDPEKEKLYLKALELERVALKKLASKRIYTNVDYWAAVVLEMLGVPPGSYLAVFATSRVAGWLAHVLEYLEENRIIRPRALYVGELDLPYVPLEERG